MYEYLNTGGFVPSKEPSNQTGGSWVTKVTVEEKFDEAGKLVGRITTTEYSKSETKSAWPYGQPIAINYKR